MVDLEKRADFEVEIEFKIRGRLGVRDDIGKEEQGAEAAREGSADGSTRAMFSKKLYFTPSNLESPCRPF